MRNWYFFISIIASVIYFVDAEDKTSIYLFISILGIVFWAMEIKQFVRNNKNY